MYCTRGWLFVDNNISRVSIQFFFPLIKFVFDKWIYVSCVLFNRSVYGRDAINEERQFPLDARVGRSQKDPHDLVSCKHDVKISSFAA